MRAVLEDKGTPGLVDVQAARARRQAAREGSTDELRQNRLRHTARGRRSPMSGPAVDPPQVFSSPRSELSPPQGVGSRCLVRLCPPRSQASLAKPLLLRLRETRDAELRADSSALIERIRALEGQARAIQAPFGGGPAKVAADNALTALSLLAAALAEPPEEDVLAELEDTVDGIGVLLTDLTRVRNPQTSTTSLRDTATMSFVEKRVALVARLETLERHARALEDTFRSEALRLQTGELVSSLDLVKPLLENAQTTAALQDAEDAIDAASLLLASIGRLK